MLRMCASCLLAVGAMGMGASSALADQRNFSFAEIGTTYTGLIFASDPIVGQQVVLARIFLEVEVFPGADAGQFDTDLSFPLIPLEGNRNALSISGAELGWLGSGTFTYMFETTEFNGTFRATIFGAATAPLDGMIIKESRVEMYTVPAPAAPVVLGAGVLLACRRRR